jgi:amidohydrolase
MMKYVEAVGDELCAVALTLHANPELGMCEYDSSKLLAATLDDFGFTVTKPFAGLKTAFKAEFGSGSPCFCFIAEYDALPGLGHACGHNLIAISALAAGKALADAMKSEGIDGSVVVMGTPGEEGEGGKVVMLEAEAFTGIDAAIMAHPLDKTATWGGSLGVIRRIVEFHGVSAHAAAAPEEGRNALDAVNLLFTGIGAWRQHLPEGTRVHGIITDGGIAPNIIPARSEASFYLRAKDDPTLNIMNERFENIAKGAALMTGTTCSLRKGCPDYRSGKPDKELNDAFFKAAEAIGMNPVRGEGVWKASTDFGDVSQVLPGTHVSFNVFENPDSAAALHTIKFAEIAKSDYAISQALKVGAAMAMVGYDFITTKSA